jgi:hypothetical protein
MNLVNLTPFPAGVTLATDKDGQEHVLAVAKGTFSIGPDGRATRAAQPQPLVYADQFYGEPGLSSIRYEVDFALRKPRADVLLTGSAVPPGGFPAEVSEVTLSFGPIQKTVRVFGERIWKPRLLGGYTISTPVPFSKMPLVYERAFGGGDTSHPDEKKHAFEEHNLVGRGFHARLHEGIAGSFLPNLENPARLMGGPLDRPEPIGFGVLGRNWRPRRTFAGTYDDKWKEERFPFLPCDFDDRYFQGAPQDQTCPPPTGGQRGTVSGVTLEGHWPFEVPSVRVPVKIVSRGGREEDVPSVIDTLILEPDLRRIVVVWRASTPLRGKAHSLREVWVGTPSRGRLRALATGKEYKVWARAKLP